MSSARVVDAVGPPWVRSLELAGAVVALFVGALLLPDHGGTGGAIASIGIALFFARGRPAARAPAQDVELSGDVGSLRIRGTRGAARCGQTILARDVIGASVAPGSDGPGLALVRRAAPDRPLLLAFRTTGDLEMARRALGIRYGGFGEVGWPAGRVASAIPRLRTAMATLWLVLAACCLCAPAALALQIAAWTLTITPLGLVVLALLVAFEPPASRITLDSLRLAWQNAAGVTCAVPCADLAETCVDHHTMRLRGPRGSYEIDVQGLCPDERDQLATHVRAAGRRGRGEGALPSVAPSSLGGLAPRVESARAWIERLDATAVALHHPTTAYRGESLDEEELWGALESPDAPAVLRAAAARVLARASPREAGVRVAKVLAASRDAEVRGAILGALEEDVDEAARALDAARSTRT